MLFRVVHFGVRASLVALSLMIAVPVHAADDDKPGAKDAAAEQEDKSDEKAVKSEKQKPTKPDVVEVKETGEDGEKAYKFGEVEVEGRLKAPQILYFLRRVRAEFRAGLLGHRSFLPELSDTRRSPALR
jgi:hypothetical protein